MTNYLGDIAEDSTIRFHWDTANGSGASITRATDGTVVVYKDGGTTESTAGVTDTEDFDSLTGVHLCAIDTSADAFYATGSDYSVVLQAATIDGETVNATLATFSIENRSSGGGGGGGSTEYPNGAVWIDADASNTNTVSGTDGLPSNPVSTFAAAETLAAAIGLSRFMLVSPTAELALTAGITDREIIGIGGRVLVDLNNKSVDTVRFMRCDITGAASSAPKTDYTDCALDGVTIRDGVARRCSFANTITLHTPGPARLIDCFAHSITQAPTFDHDTLAASKLFLNNWSGDFSISNSTSNSNFVYVTGSGRVTIESSCTDLGLYHSPGIEVTDNSTGTGAVVTEIAPVSITGTEVQADVVKILGEDLTENTAGRLAQNASVLLDNGDAASTLTLSALTTVASNVSTLVNRIGAFTGSGVNTVLGFFQAMMRSDATLPSDVGGTFSPVTHALQAIRARGDAAWTTAVGILDAAGIRSAIGMAIANLDAQLAALAAPAGNGANTVTITVETTGSSPISGANVKMTHTASGSSAFGTSTAAGVVTLACDDYSDWDIAIEATGYVGQTDVVDVSGDTQETFQLTASYSATPSAPGHATGSILVLDCSGDPVEGESYSIRYEYGGDLDGVSPCRDVITVTTDSDGIAEFVGMIHEATYSFARGTTIAGHSGVSPFGQRQNTTTTGTVTVPIAASFNISEVTTA